MRLAIIDLGTNSVRFDVVELGENDRVRALYREKLMIRLGEGVFLRRKLDRHSIGVCIDAFQSFARTLDDFQVKRIVAFGTSALREARDGERLIRRIKRESGISVRIISGDEEARLIARGVLQNEAALRGRFALVDIGGGSTEVTICSGKKILRSASFPLGTARLQQVFLKTIPPNLKPQQKGNSIDLLKRHIRGILLFRLVADEWPKVERIIGSSGTIRALTRISKKETGSDIVERKFLDDLVARMLRMNRLELERIPGMEPRRVDMILSGAILLQECMSAVHANYAELTEFSLRDGILDEQIEILKAHRKLQIINPVHNLFLAAEKLGCRPAELRQSVRIAEDIFDRLKRVHGLQPIWREHLVCASILESVGRAISSVAFEYHSAYMASYLDSPGLTESMRRMISELLMQHRNGRILKKEAPFKKDKKTQRIYFKLLALFRLSAALSFQRSKPVMIEKVVIKRGQVKILVSKRYSPDLEVLRAEQRKQIFEEVFHRKLRFELV